MYAKSAAFIVALLSMSLLLSAAVGQVTNPTGGGSDSSLPNVMCSNECDYSGRVSCDGSYVKACGNYDSDSCLEWNLSGYCVYGCIEGACKRAPDDSGGTGGAGGGSGWNVTDEPGNGTVKTALNFTCGMPKDETLFELSKLRMWYLTKAGALWQYMETLRGGASGLEVSGSDAKAYVELEQTRLRYLARAAEIGSLMERIGAMECEAPQPPSDVQNNGSSGYTPPGESPPAGNDSSNPPAPNATGGGMGAVMDMYSNDLGHYDSLNISDRDRYEVKKNEWLRYNDTASFREAMNESYMSVSAAPTLAANEAAVFIPEVSADDVLRIDVQKEAGVPVRSMDISMRKSARASEVMVRRLGSRPQTAASAPAARDTYAYVEIEKGMDDDAIEDVAIGFEVEKEWLSEKKISRTGVVLYRYAGGNWTELPTRWLGEDEVNVYYESFSPGLSFFVIGITAAAASPIQIELPSDTVGGEGAGNGGDIATIKLDWLFIVIVVLLIAALKFTPLSKKISGALMREKPKDLEKRLLELKAEREEALNRYYKRQITEQQMTSIVNDKKKQEFDIEMKLKRAAEKKAGKAQQAKPSPQANAPEAQGTQI
ncbi:MAG: PGF-pre-PGF domain-containing protein [Candidatus Aenigmatarchaeota archaeon]